MGIWNEASKALFKLNSWQITDVEAQPLTPQNFNLFEANIYLPDSNKNPFELLTFWHWFRKDSPWNKGCNSTITWEVFGCTMFEEGINYLHNKGMTAQGLFEIRWGQERDSHWNSSALSHQPPLYCKVTVPTQRGSTFPMFSLDPPLCPLSVPSLCPLQWPSRSWGCWTLRFLSSKPKKDRNPCGDSPALSLLWAHLKGDPNIFYFIIFNIS